MTGGISRTLVKNNQFRKNEFMKRFFTLGTLFLPAVIILLTSGFLFFVGPEFIQSRLYEFAPTDRGPAGDAFNGILGPVIAWIAAVLTFAAFYIQYEANKEQRKQFERQANDTTVQRFENKFFEMIKIHRDNVVEMNIEDTIRGRKAFTSFYYEFRYVYFKLKKNYDEIGRAELAGLNEKKKLSNIAYLLFFYGVGFNSNNILTEIFKKYEKMDFLKKTISELERERIAYRRYKEDKRPLIVEYDNDKATFRVKYQPFSGHAGKLGHYFRHLFQTVKFVHEQDKKIIGDKYAYVKTLRAQLSNFEQLLLYYNSISVLGNEWLRNRYMHEYEMVRNIPLPFANFGVLPHELFREDIEKGDMNFEWDEVKKKIDIMS